MYAMVAPANEARWLSSARAMGRSASNDALGHASVAHVASCRQLLIRVNSITYACKYDCVIPPVSELRRSCVTASPPGADSST